MALITSNCGAMRLPEQHADPNHPGLCALQIGVDSGLVKAYMRRGFAYEGIERYAAALGESWLTAAIPMESPYCSCKLTRCSVAEDMRTVVRLNPNATDAMKACSRLQGFVRQMEKMKQGTPAAPQAAKPAAAAPAASKKKKKEKEAAAPAAPKASAGPTAEELKARANNAFKKQAYAEAAQLYSDAIDVCTDVCTAAAGSELR